MRGRAKGERGRRGGEEERGGEGGRGEMRGRGGGASLLHLLKFEE